MLNGNTYPLKSKINAVADTLPALISHLIRKLI